MPLRTLKRVWMHLNLMLLHRIPTGHGAAAYTLYARSLDASKMTKIIEVGDGITQGLGLF